MNFLERTILALRPGWAATRARHRAQAMHFDAASVGRRTSSLRASRTDADAAAAGRSRIAFYARDMVRNTPVATRIQSVVAGAVVGDGIIPKVTLAPGIDINDGASAEVRARGLELIEQHFDTSRIDRAGRLNLYGLQRLVMATVVESGECLIRIHGDPVPGGLCLQLEVLEPDYLDDGKFGWRDDGGEIREGIEYDGAGRRVAYWLFDGHPGASFTARPGTGISRRVPADEVMHIFRMDRPGQNRGVPWLAPVMLRLQDLADHEEAQLIRQKVASCFAVFRVGGDGEAANIEEIQPGAVYDLGDSQDVRFAAPPGVEGYDEFTRSVLRSVAAGVGVSYEALTGDLGQVNFSSARMGRLEMDQNTSAWQHLMLMPQMMQPLSRLFRDAWQRTDALRFLAQGLPPDIWGSIAITWVPPRKIIVDPAREFAALREAVRSGFTSRQQVIRQLGFDPERLLEEIAQDREEADRLGLPFDSDPRADVSRQSRIDDPGDRVA